MRITKQLDMDLSRRGVAQTLEAVQGDGNTRCVALRLFDGGTPWNVPAGVTGAVAFRKPDAHKGLYDTLPDGSAAVTIAGSTVTAILAPQALTCAGEVQAAVVLHDANLNQLATFPFRVDVSPNPAAGSVLSNDYYKYSTMEAVSEAVDAALTALEESKQAFLSKAEEALEAVHDAATEDAPAIVCQVSGSVISVSDASERLLQGLILCGKTTQSATPSPEAPVALENAGAGGSVGVTVAGKNLFDESQLLNASGWTEKNGEYSGTIGKLESAYGKGFDLPPFLPNTQYTFSMYCYVDTNANGERARFTVEYTDGTNASLTVYETAWQKQTYTTTAGKSVAKFGFTYGSNNVTVMHLKNIQVEIGLVATEYEPCKPIQTLTAQTPNGLPGIPVASGGNYTDEAGQEWICDEIDFARGVYVQRVNKNILTGDEYWAADGNSFCAGCNPAKAPNTHSICTHMPVYGAATLEIIYYRFTDSGISNKDAWIAWLAEQYASETPVEVLYVLKTPVETPLSAQELAAYAALHSNKPNTTVFNDAGAGLKLCYIADTKTYIDNQFAQLRNAILSAGANV